MSFIPRFMAVFSYKNLDSENLFSNCEFQENIFVLFENVNTFDKF